MIIQESCLYNTGVLCGGAAERLGGKCEHCGWNPECFCRRKKVKLALKAKPEKKGKDWHNSAKWRKAMDLYEMGYKDKGIADILRCNYKEITRWREHNGLPPQKPRKPRPREYDWEKGMELYYQGLTNIQIADALGCSIGAVGHQLEKHGLKRNVSTKTRYDWDPAMKMYKEGCNDRQIAIRLGCSFQAVSYWRQKNNLPVNGENKNE